MGVLVAVLACVVAAQYVLIAVTVVPQLARLATSRHRLIEAAKWGATFFFVGCAVTHLGIAYHSAFGSAHAEPSSTRMFFEHVIPHIAQIVGGATFIWIAKYRLEIRVAAKDDAQLRDLEHRLQHALEAGGLGTWELDLETDEFWHSQQHDRIFGYDVPAMGWNRRSLLEHVIDADKEFVRSQVMPPGRRASRSFECRIRRADGEERWIAIEGTPVTDDAGRATRVMGTVADITERKRRDAERDALEQELQQARRIEAVGRLAGGVAHDFNNLLTVINGYADMALQDPATDGRLRAQLEAIAAAGARGQQLTGQLLTVSRRQVQRPELIDVNLVTSETLAMLGRLIGDDVTVDATLGDDIGPVLIDSGQFSQILLNLAVNARDAMPDGGVLTITTSAIVPDRPADDGDRGEIRGEVRIAVGDNGQGMSESTRSRLFEPFFTTKAAGAGTGLGLSTVYGIVTLAGGRIEVESELGAGSTFIVHLPVATGAGPDADAPEPAGDLRGTERVLVVEDDQDVRALSRTILTAQGYDVVDVDGPDAALRLDPHAFDLLLTDVLMPTMNGRQLAARLTAIHPELRVVYVSAYPSNAINADDIATERFQFLAKPYTPRALLRKVRAVLDATI